MNQNMISFSCSKQEMMRLLHITFSWILIVIGIVHIIFGFSTFSSFSLSLLWFEGSGLAMIFIGLINFLFRLNPDTALAYKLCQTGNLLLLIFIIAINTVNLMIPGVLGFITLLVLSVATHKTYIDKSG